MARKPSTKLTVARIDAVELLQTVPDWDVWENAVYALGKKFPDNDVTSVLLKAAAIKQLYAIPFLALWSTTKHLVKVMADSPSVDAALVDRLAQVPGENRQTRFASKFVHF